MILNNIFLSSNLQIFFQNGNVSCAKEVCPVLNCPESTIIHKENECCPSCEGNIFIMPFIFNNFSFHYFTIEYHENVNCKFVRINFLNIDTTLLLVLIKYQTHG